jgi:hypothetical protein
MSATRPAGTRRSPSGLVVRRAGPADARPLAALVHLVTSNGPQCQSVDDVARFLADPHNYQIVAEEENRLVSSSTMMYRPWNDSYELGRDLTRPDCHRRGLGALLMQRVVDWVCDAALGEVFIASVRARCLVDPRTALNPPMIVAGHDTDRIVANGAREPHLITLSIPEHARFVHVTPPVAESASGAFIRERIYHPLRLRFAPGEYPPESLVGATSDWSLDWGGLVVDYNPDSPNRALAIVGVRDRSVLSEHFSRDLDRVLRALPHVEHVIVTVLADKTDFLRQLFVLGFELAAYLPAWYKGGVFRYDCVHLVLRRSGGKLVARDRRDPLSRLQREIASDRRSILSGPRRPQHRSTRTEDPAMSPLTIAGLPVLAIIEDFNADATGHARRRAETLTPGSNRQTPGQEGSGAKADRRPARVSEDGVTPMMGSLGLALLILAMVFAPEPAAANPACNALIAGNVTLTADMNCTAATGHGLRLSANTTLNILKGVTAGSNSITHSKAALIAGKNSVVAINATTGNTGTSLYISPPTITTRVDGTSSFTLTTQTTTPPLCY